MSKGLKIVLAAFIIVASLLVIVGLSITFDKRSTSEVADQATSTAAAYNYYVVVECKDMSQKLAGVIPFDKKINIQNISEIELGISKSNNTLCTLISFDPVE